MLSTEAGVWCCYAQRWQQSLHNEQGGLARDRTTAGLAWRAVDSTSVWQPICVPTCPLSEHRVPACRRGFLVVPESCWPWPVSPGPLELLRNVPGHINFMKYLGLAWMSPPAGALPKPMFLVCLQGGDLRAALTSSEPGKLSWYGKGRQLCLDILKGLVFLHKHKVRC